MWKISFYVTVYTLYIICVDRGKVQNTLNLDYIHTPNERKNLIGPFSGLLFPDNPSEAKEGNCLPIKYKPCSNTKRCGTNQFRTGI